MQGIKHKKIPDYHDLSKTCKVEELRSLLMLPAVTLNAYSINDNYQKIYEVTQN